MLIDSFNLLLITGAVYGVLFNFATLSFLSKRKITKAIVYLNIMVLSLSLNNLQAWLIAKRFISSCFFIQHLKVPWYLFIVPAFYSFLIYFLKIETLYKNYMLSVFIVFGLEISVRMGVITHCYSSGQSEELIKIYTQYEELVNAIISIFLFWNCLRILFRDTNKYPFALAFDDLKWLKYFMVLGSFVISFWVLAVVTNLFLEVSLDEMYYPLRLGTSLLLYWIGFQGFHRYHVRADRVELRKDILNLEKSFGKGKPITPTKTTLDTLYKMMEHIQTEKLFLDPNLSLEECAKELQVSPSHLSKTINNYSNSHFTDLVNEYRVKYAKTLLKNPDFEHYTILSIGLESGFNSKSTFYSAFKKATKQTPSVYKKSKLT